MSERLVIDDLSFDLRWSHRRRTVGITVDRDGSLILHAPADCPAETVERVARAKRFWIYTRLAQKEGFSQPTGGREFVSGEGFYYLGRSYRLKLVDASSSEPAIAPLRLQQGRFLLRRDEQQRGREHFVRWYVAHGSPWLQRRVALLAERIGVAPHAVRIRDLGFRWGSCSRNGQLNFHWRTVLLPPRIIDYVVAHELVHLHERGHGPSFWKRLERAMPDFAARKQWLAEHGGHFY